MHISTNRLTDAGRPLLPKNTQPLNEQTPPVSSGNAPERPLYQDARSTVTRDVTAQAASEVDVESGNLTSALDLGSEATGRFGSKLKVGGLETLSGALATPGAALHLLRTGSQLVSNPSDLVRQAGQVLENPLEAAQNAWDAVTETKDAVETLLGAAELGREAVVSTAGSIKQNGLKAGLNEAGQNLRALARKNYTELRENISSTTGGGLTHAAKELAAQTEGRTTRQVAKALSDHLYTNPALAPQGFFARAQRAGGNLIDATSDRVMGVANRLADGTADLLARTPVGQSILNGLDYLNPSRHVSEAALAAAAKEGTANGIAAGTEAVVNGLKKAGHEVVTDTTSGAITRIVSKTGQEIAVEGLQAATQAGVQAAVREGAEAGVKATAKGLGRFAPGVNVALAAYDVYHAGQVWADPNASGWQKGMASVTALGSIAAATNIPIVSQVGAGISLASSVLENIPPTVIADAGKAVARGAVNAGRAAVRGAANAGRVAVTRVTNATRAATQAVANISRTAVRGFTNTGQAALASAGNAASAIGGGLKKIGGFFGFGG